MVCFFVIFQEEVKMPELNEMMCPICNELVGIDVIEANNGMCVTCNAAMKEIEEEEGRGAAGEEMLSDPQMAQAIERYRKRKAYMKKYNAKPEVREARKAYSKERRQLDQRLIQRARELGIIKKEDLD
jgi:hypothetical protein